MQSRPDVSLSPFIPDPKFPASDYEVVKVSFLDFGLVDFYRQMIYQCVLEGKAGVLNRAVGATGVFGDTHSGPEIHHGLVKFSRV